MLLLSVFALLLWEGCDVLLDDEDADDRDVLFQASTLNALLDGAYDGVITFDDLADHGDFGLGTVDGLDGEMITLDGTAYQVRSDGVATPIDGAVTSPFAVLTHFDADTTVVWEAEFGIASLEALDCPGLQAVIDGLLPDREVPYAVQVEGTFTTLRTRSVDRQEPPYRPLADVLVDQVEFDFTDVEGTMVGFRLPEYMAGFNVAGYHFHFLTADRTTGGHVLACEPGAVTITADDIDVWQVVLPDTHGAEVHPDAARLSHP